MPTRPGESSIQFDLQGKYNSYTCEPLQCYQWDDMKIVSDPQSINIVVVTDTKLWNRFLLSQ